MSSVIHSLIPAQRMCHMTGGRAVFPRIKRKIILFSEVIYLMLVLTFKIQTELGYWF